MGTSANATIADSVSDTLIRRFRCRIRIGMIEDQFLQRLRIAGVVVGIDEIGSNPCLIGNRVDGSRKLGLYTDTVVAVGIESLGLDVPLGRITLDIKPTRTDPSEKPRDRVN